MRLVDRLIPFGISLILTPFALLAGFLSAGAGEGNWILAKGLFPYAFLHFVVRPSSETV